MVNNNGENVKITILTPEFYNYGALLIGGILKDAGYVVDVQKGFEKEVNADIVILSLHSTIHLIKYKLEIEKIKGFKIVGGPVSRVPELIFKYLPVDVVVIGEGEVSTLDLVDKLGKDLDNSELEEVKGIAFKNGVKIDRKSVV